VTPKGLQQALNTTIFPELSITLKKPICEWTARRWLIKLGWRHTVVRKGVYMDGHERDDVVKYHNELFLPQMQIFENRMVHWEGPSILRTEPSIRIGLDLWPIVAYFHDESCFQKFSK
jgi:hypothetical protein